MKILVAEDEAVSRRLLESTLRRWGYEVIGRQRRPRSIALAPRARCPAVGDSRLDDAGP